MFYIAFLHYYADNKGVIKMYCNKCGVEVEGSQEYCSKCGQKVGAGVNNSTHVVYGRTKNEGLAAILSLIFPGLGQMYANRVMRGLGIIVAGIVLAVIGVLLLIPLLILLVLWIWNIFDAYNLSKEYNESLTRNGSAPW